MFFYTRVTVNLRGRMDIRQLKCFDAVLSSGAMTRAAEILGLAQPTVSITIAQLEQEIGFVLFERSRGRLEPTPEAYALHQVAMLALESVSRVSQVANQIQRRATGEISILCYPGIAWRFMPELINSFRAKKDGVRVKLISRSSESLRQLILPQNYDVAIVESPVLQPIGRMQLYRYTCDCALPVGHFLASKKLLRPQDLSGAPFVTLFPDHVTNHQLRKSFADSAAHFRVILECDFFASAYSVVRSGGGITLLDPITAAHIDKSAVVMRPFEPKVRYEIAVVRPSNRPHSGIADDFCELLHTSLGALSNLSE